MVALLIRNLVFTILQPGIVAGLIPYLIWGNKANDTFAQQLWRLGLLSSGIILFIIGFVIIRCTVLVQNCKDVLDRFNYVKTDFYSFYS